MSAEYLEMPDLISFCVSFISQNLKLVCSEGEQVGNFRSGIAKKVARQVSVEELDELEEFDTKDLLFSRLYKKKLELYFEVQSNLMFYCVECGRLYTEEMER